MSINQLNPYLNFNGTAAKAIALYEKALGAKIESVMRFAEVPGMNVPPEQKDKIMHSALRIGPNLLMVSDTMAGQPVTAGTNTHVCMDFDDVEELKQRFDALSAGGKVVMAPHDAFWGATFAMLVDAFGIQWMFHCEKKKPA